MTKPFKPSEKQKKLVKIILAILLFLTFSFQLFCIILRDHQHPINIGLIALLIILSSALLVYKKLPLIPLLYSLLVFTIISWMIMIFTFYLPYFQNGITIFYYKVNGEIISTCNKIFIFADPKEVYKLDLIQKIKMKSQALTKDGAIVVANLKTTLKCEGDNLSDLDQETVIKIKRAVNQQEKNFEKYFRSYILKHSGNEIENIGYFKTIHFPPTAIINVSLKIAFRWDGKMEVSTIKVIWPIP